MESSGYLRARQEWDERYADLVLRKREWLRQRGCEREPSGDYWESLRSPRRGGRVVEGTICQKRFATFSQINSGHNR